MSYQKTKKKFGRERKVRIALLKSLALSLVNTGKIKTTDAKARAVRPLIEKMITQGRTNTVANKRLLISKIGAIGANKIIKDIAPKYIGRSGGYTRITKLPQRVSDGSFMAVIELI